MTNRRDPLMDRIDSWMLEDDGAVVSERVMDSVTAALPGTRQAGARWSLAALSWSRIARLGFAVGGMAAAAALILVYFNWSSNIVYQPSPSPEQSASASSEPSPLPSISPTVLSALDVGGVGIVVASEPLVLRSAAGTGADSTILAGRLWPGMRFGIVDGPVTASGYEWYFIRVGELEGWAAAASKDAEPWIASVQNGAIAYGGVATTTTGNQDDSAMELRAIARGGVSVIASLSYADLQLETDLDSAAGGGAVDCPGGMTVAWSPQGDRIALSAHYECNGVIYTVDADGTDLVRRSDGQNPVWSPDGTRIAFGLNAPWFGCDPSYCQRPSDGWEIQVASLPGGASVSLTRSESLATATSPLWSPDGRTIAFLSTDLSAGWPQAASYQVQLINADGSGQRLFLSAGQPIEWSPDGRSILVFRNVDLSSPPEIWVVRIDGSGEVRLPTPGPMVGGQHAAWSPDGSQIAVSGWDQDGVSSTYLMRPDGSDATAIASSDAFEEWSPDGRELLLSRFMESGEQQVVLFSLIDEVDRVIGDISGVYLGLAWQPVLVYPGP